MQSPDDLCTVIGLKNKLLAQELRNHAGLQRLGLRTDITRSRCQESGLKIRQQRLSPELSQHGAPGLFQKP